MPHPMSWSLSAPYFAAALLFGYVLGSIPFGVLFTRLAGLGDIRSVGSGNIGATNVLRTGSKGLAAATLLLDALKGAAAGWIAARLWPDGARISSVAGMVAAASAPVVAAVMGRSELVPMLTGFALLVIWKHKDNLARLRAGTEPRVGRASP